MEIKTPGMSSIPGAILTVLLMAGTVERGLAKKILANKYFNTTVQFVNRANASFL
jgi:hypothetical protein